MNDERLEELLKSASIIKRTPPAKLVRRTEEKIYNNNSERLFIIFAAFMSAAMFLLATVFLNNSIYNSTVKSLSSGFNIMPNIYMQIYISIMKNLNIAVNAKSIAELNIIAADCTLYFVLTVICTTVVLKFRNMIKCSELK